MQQMPQTLTEKDIAGDLLNCMKMGTTGYTHGILESADPDIRNTFKDFLTQSISGHEKIYQYMEQQGMYKVPRLKDENMQASPGQVGTGQVSPGQMGTGQVSPGQMGTGPMPTR